MLKSLEIKASIKDLKDEIDAGIKENLDMTAKAQELEALMAEYDEALKARKLRRKILKCLLLKNALLLTAH